MINLIFVILVYQAKQRKFPFTPNITHTTHNFELVRIDIWGPYFVSFMNGYRFSLTIVDDFFRYTWIFLIHNKFEVRANVFKINLKFDGIEFAMKNFYASKEIIHHITCDEQNSIVECKYQHILNVTRALLSQYNLPIIF